MEYPGVYVEPMSSGVAITSTATSNAVFVGETLEGPSNQPTLVTSWSSFVSQFGGFAWGLQTPWSVYAFFAGGGSACWIVRALPLQPVATATATVPGGPAFAAAAPGAWGDALSLSLTGSGPSFTLEVRYQLPGAGAALSVSDQLVAAYAELNNLVMTPANGGQSVLLESYLGLTDADLTPGAGGASPLQTRLEAGSLFVRLEPAKGPQTLTAFADLTLAGGIGGPDATPLDLASAFATLAAQTDVNLLLVPDTVRIADLGAQRNAVLQACQCVAARPLNDLFLIAEAPKGLNVEQMSAFKTGAASADGRVPAGNAVNSAWGAIYYPWISILNPGSSLSVPVGPGGAAAGRYAYTDNNVGVWKAPAGIDAGALSMAVGLETVLTDADQGVLNPLGVNCIRSLINYGIVLYGARVMQVGGDVVYVSERRLLMMIEASLYQGLQWVVFEPDDQALWGAVVRDVTVFLTALWQSGALFGATASAAFFVTCDTTNNPPAQQGLGLLSVDVGLAVRMPAEFTMLRLELQTST